jgi:hypothetical protein
MGCVLKEGICVSKAYGRPAGNARRVVRFIAKKDRRKRIALMARVRWSVLFLPYITAERLFFIYWREKP